MTRFPALLFDIGGTKTRLTVTRDGRRFITPLIYPTPQRYSNALQALQGAARKLLGDRVVRSVVGGVLGTKDRQHHRLGFVPHLRDWSRQPMERDLAKVFRAPVVLQNDCELVGLGEAVYGSGRGARIVAYVTVSTGVNGVRIVDQAIEPTASGYEAGHTYLDISSNVRCSCGARGHFEALVGGESIFKQTGKQPQDIHERLFWTTRSRLLAYGLTNVAAMWSPDRIVLGGSMFKNPGLLIPVARREFAKRLTMVPAPPLVRAKLGDLGGLWGALVLARRKP